MTTYKGFDVFEMMPDQRDGRPLNVERTIVELDEGSGLFTQERVGVMPIMGSEYLLTIKGRPAIAAYQAFLAARQGRLVPFWIPNWNRDLSLSGTMADGSTELVVRSRYYTRFMFGETGSFNRRHIAVISPAGVVAPRGVVSAEDNGDGTESLTITSPGAPTNSSSHLWTFLSLVRLSNDDPKITFWTQELIQSQLTITEVPNEAPAP